jgi:hypothetical protein
VALCLHRCDCSVPGAMEGHPWVSIKEHCMGVVFTILTMALWPHQQTAVTGGAAPCRDMMQTCFFRFARSKHDQDAALQVLIQIKYEGCIVTNDGHCCIAAAVQWRSLAVRPLQVNELVVGGYGGRIGSAT